MNKLEKDNRDELLKECKEHYKIAWMDRAPRGKARTKGGPVQLHEDGTPNIIGFTIHGQFIGIELKRPETRFNTNEDQDAFQALMKLNNCVYGVAWDIESLNEILNRIE